MKNNVGNTISGTIPQSLTFLSVVCLPFPVMAGLWHWFYPHYILSKLGIRPYIPMSTYPPQKILYIYGSGSKPCIPGEPQNSWYLWMFIPLKMVLIGIDPYPYIHQLFGNGLYQLFIKTMGISPAAEPLPDLVPRQHSGTGQHGIGRDQLQRVHLRSGSLGKFHGNLGFSERVNPC